MSPWKWRCHRACIRTTGAVTGNGFCWMYYAGRSDIMMVTTVVHVELWMSQDTETWPQVYIRSVMASHVRWLLSLRN